MCYSGVDLDRDEMTARGGNRVLIIAGIVVLVLLAVIILPFI